MLIYEEYRLYHRKNAGHRQMTASMGLLPIAVAAAFLAAHGASAMPGLWAALGFGFALQMILWSGINLPRHARGRSALSTRLARSIDAWFPFFLISIQGGFVATTVLALWYTVCDLGFQASAAQHITLVLLLVLWPVRRLLVCRQSFAPSAAGAMRVAACGYLLTIVSTILVAVSMDREVIHPDATAGAAPAGSVILWIVAGMVITICAVMLIDQWVRAKPPRRKTGGPTPATQTTTEPVDSL